MLAAASGAGESANCALPPEAGLVSDELTGGVVDRPAMLTHANS